MSEKFECWEAEPRRCLSLRVGETMAELRERMLREPPWEPLGRDWQLPKHKPSVITSHSPAAAAERYVREYVATDMEPGDSDEITVIVRDGVKLYAYEVRVEIPDPKWECDVLHKMSVPCDRDGNPVQQFADKVTAPLFGFGHDELVRGAGR